MNKIPFWPKVLGFAGLLPPIAIIALGEMNNPATHSFSFWGVVYGMLILTFLGGAWWAFAAQKAKPPAGIMILSVLPSLIAFMLLVLSFSFMNLAPRLSGLVVGILILLSPLVDGWLHQRGMTPKWWMRLRLPLSLMLGTLTILAGHLA
ncbi:DUF3429 domain-containing protein [Sphingomicrobium sediminis]|uniref:DUF3429 domain-containing protein n=1 Tax=Sphingomicrobium sediminis TaxID=2950949 RepID=A0A9X2EK50_9SPHN|nr:DUF3429 domain-containing protein [Sphingomicrobium sediminis]MCM8557089.1 DUF3429 domain-containing protein [Sphingomicrobium sediminis]